MTDAATIARGLTEGEQARLLMGRTDWRESDWQDHCGIVWCEYCSGYIDTHIAPNLLSEADKAVRAELERIADE